MFNHWYFTFGYCCILNNHEFLNLLNLYLVQYEFYSFQIVYFSFKFIQSIKIGSTNIHHLTNLLVKNEIHFIFKNCWKKIESFVVNLGIVRYFFLWICLIGNVILRKGVLGAWWGQSQVGLGEWRGSLARDATCCRCAEPRSANKLMIAHLFPSSLAVSLVMFGCVFLCSFYFPW